MKILERFDCMDTLLTKAEKQAAENILIEYHGIFASHRMDIGMNMEFKAEVISKDEKAIHSQNLPMPIHLKQDLIVKLPLMQKYGIITVLPFSKYASPFLNIERPTDNYVFLWTSPKINIPIADVYNENNHPVGTLSDAAQHFAGNSLLCKLQCSQAYHCLQMADQRSLEMLAFNFSGRIFAYK